MGIPGSQEVVAAGSSAPSQVGAGRAGSVAGPGPEAYRARGEQMASTALGLEGARAPSPGSAPRSRSRPRLPSSSPTLGPTLPGIRPGRAEYKMATRPSALRAESGRPFVRRARAPDAPLKIAGTRLYLVRRIPARTRASYPAPPHAAPR